jgi:hypothetical protein
VRETKDASVGQHAGTDRSGAEAATLEREVHRRGHAPSAGSVLNREINGVFEGILTATLRRRFIGSLLGSDCKGKTMLINQR